MDWLDISVPIRDGMVTFEGDPAVHVERVKAIAHGDICNVSRLDFGVHSGTHIDAPIHFIDGAPALEAVPLDALIGPTYVVDASGIEGAYDRAAIDRLGIPAGTERLLLRGRNSDLWDKPSFDTSFVAVTADGAAALVERGLRLVGADYLSIAPFDTPIPTHVALLAAGVVIVEGLDLRAIEPGWYDLICLPLLIPGCDGGPARAIVRRRPA
jgi:arylformamidase